VTTADAAPGKSSEAETAPAATLKPRATRTKASGTTATRTRRTASTAATDDAQPLADGESPAGAPKRRATRKKAETAPESD
jgi:hypothetical protein